MLADVGGHGLPAALYTMCLGTLWETNLQLLSNPVQFTAAMSKGLADMVKDSGPFATAVCGLVDLREQCLRLASGRTITAVSRQTELRDRPVPGHCIRLIQAEYDEVRLEFGPRNRVLLAGAVAGAIKMALAGAGPMRRTGVSPVCSEPGLRGIAGDSEGYRGIAT